MSDAPAVGSIRLYDSARPDLEAGDYAVVSTLAITSSGAALPAPPPATTYFTIEAPRFVLEDAQVAGCHPTPQARGGFDDRLPHVALGRRTLPWERSGPGGAPWLALLVVAENEGHLVKGPLSTLLPAAVVSALKSDEAFSDDPAVTALQMNSGTLLAGLLPRTGELALLTHVRQVNLQDSALAGTDDDGWFAIVAANRLPQAGAQDTNFLACLVSLEQRADLWLATGAAAPPPVLVLHAWNFTTTTAGGGSFDTLAAGLDAAPFGTAVPALLDTKGTLRLDRHDRQGGSTPVRYRGPLLGTSAAALPTAATDISHDSALELGRLLGSADARFLREVVAWQRASENQARAALAVQRLQAVVAPVAGPPTVAPGGLRPLPALDNLPQLLSTAIAGQAQADVPLANLWQLHPGGPHR